MQDVLKQYRIHRELAEKAEAALKELHRLRELERQSHEILLDTTEFHEKAANLKEGEMLFRVPGGKFKICVVNNCSSLH